MEMTVAQIARALTGDVVGDPDKKINGIAPIETASPDDITYAAETKSLKRIDATQAGAVIVPSKFSLADHNLIQVDNPEAAFAKVILFFTPPPSGARYQSHGQYRQRLCVRRRLPYRTLGGDSGRCVLGKPGCLTSTGNDR